MTNRKQIKLASKHSCTGCMACVDACGNGAITSALDSAGHLYPHINSSKCVACGRCMQTCPVVSKFTYRQDYSGSQPYAAWSTDRPLRLRSSSGGIFGAVAKSVITAGGMACGCVMDGLKARHIIIDDLQKLPLLQGSKYVHSNMEGNYKAMKKLLDGGRQVLYCGTRCQVAALLSFLRKPYEKLLTIELVCSGTPSAHLLEFYSGRYKTIQSFRTKKNGWQHGYHVTALLADGTPIDNFDDADIQEEGYLGGQTHRFACNDCRFCGLTTKADLTVMDYWGEKDHPDQHHDGISCLLINSDKGRQALNEAGVELRVSTWAKCLPHNPRIAFGWRPFFNWRIDRLMVPYAFTHFSRPTLKAIYGHRRNRNGLKWLPLRAMMYAHYLILQLYYRISIRRLLKTLE